MKDFLFRYIALTVVAALVAYGFPRPSNAQQIPKGEATSEAAAGHAPAKAVRRTVPASMVLGSVVGAVDAAASVAHSEYLHISALALAQTEPDTTSTFEFPEDENDNLVRDITVFVIVSAFVAFFLIKVFFEEDPPEEEPDTGGGKVIPGAGG